MVWVFDVWTQRDHENHQCLQSIWWKWFECAKNGSNRNLPFLVFDTSRFVFCMVFNCCLERDSECNEFIAQHVEFMPFKMAQCSKCVHKQWSGRKKQLWHHRPQRCYCCWCLRSSFSKRLVLYSINMTPRIVRLCVACVRVCLMLNWSEDNSGVMRNGTP